MRIDYITENVPLPELNYSHIDAWIESVIRFYGFIPGRLTYCFCDDDYILLTNKEFLNHDYYTDIITFDYSRKGIVSGDMVISLDTVKSNSEEMGLDYRSELLRVIVHGVLHLCGINDKGPGERELMEAAENRALEMWNKSGAKRDGI